MVLYKVDPDLPSDPNNSAENILATPSETVVDDHSQFGGAQQSSSSVPWPGSTFIIRSIASGHVITFVDGQVVLAPPGGRGTIRWACVETKGWFGFRDESSGAFLGYDGKGRLCCSVMRQQEWENFCARIRPEGGYLLLMTHWDNLWPIGTCLERGVVKLAKIGNGESGGIVWDFVKV